MKALVFDTETTGTDVTRDRIVELCIMDWETGRTCEWRFNPCVPIPPEATSVHGISNEDIVNCPLFSEREEDIRNEFSSYNVLIGYNVQFDIDMIQSELERCSTPIDMTGKLIVDPLKLWMQKEPRNLSGAYERFVGKKMEGAHEARADTIATGEILLSMMRDWKFSEGNWDELATACNPERASYVGDTHHFLWAGDVAVFGFGKHKGEPILKNKGYLQWMQGSSFPKSVHDVISIALVGGLKR